VVSGESLKLSSNDVQVMRTTTYSSVHALAVDPEFDFSPLSHLVVMCMNPIVLNPSDYSKGDRLMNVSIEVEQFLRVIRSMMNENRTMLVLLVPPVAFPIPPGFMADHESAMSEVRTFAEHNRRVFVCDVFTPTRTQSYKERPQLVSAGVASYMQHTFASVTLLMNAFNASDEAVELVRLLR